MISLRFESWVFFGRPRFALVELAGALAGLSLRDLLGAEDEACSSALRLVLRVLSVPAAAV